MDGWPGHLYCNLCQPGVSHRPMKRHLATTAVLLLLGAGASRSHALVRHHARPVARSVSHRASLHPATAPRTIEFLRDVAPILDKFGCSGAQCHGKFGGRGGFQLSLLTLSPEDDYAPIVYGGRGRRVNFAHPEESLLLLKPTEQISHGGGLRFDKDSPQYRTILRWIREGAPFSSADPRLISLTLEPRQVTLKRAGQKLQLKAVATYSDGSRRNVTSQAVFQSSNAAVLSVGDDGTVTASRWGGGAILVRYLGVIAASFITLPEVRAGRYPSVPEANLIDHYVFRNLRALNVVPSALCDDSEFLRRVMLDTVGRLPTPDERASFLADKNPNKRSSLVDRLLNDPGYADLRTLRLADLLRVNPQKLGTGTLADRSGELFYEWIWNQVQSNTPWNQFVTQILMARGSTYQVGPACFYRIETSANDRMENLSQAFLGIRMSCARCHKHPFDRWTTNDYWNFAAFMQKVDTSRGNLYDEDVIGYNPNAQLRNQSVLGRNRGKIAPPTFLGDASPAPASTDMIAELANWVTAPTNPYFARAAVNRLWSYYFGRGIIEPVDDMRATTPESVPGLLEALSSQFVSSGYNVRAMVRLMLTSRTYQLSSIPNRSNLQDDRFFSHFIVRPMPAQVLLDMVNEATGAREQFGAFPDRARAIQAAFPIRNQFVDSFGESHREFLTDLDPHLEPNLVQTLAMINSPYIANKVRYGSTLQEVLKTAKTPVDLVRECYIRTLCRDPSDREIAAAANLMAQDKTPRDGAEDLLWALVSSREFYFNH